MSCKELNIQPLCSYCLPSNRGDCWITWFKWQITNAVDGIEKKDIKQVIIKLAKEYIDADFNNAERIAFFLEITVKTYFPNDLKTLENILLLR
jgi:hypothetical protein